MPRPKHASVARRRTPPRPDAALELKKALARVQQLRNEIQARQEENEQIVAENLRQNEELRSFNEDLENKVKLRTWELMTSKQKLESQTRQLQELDTTKEALMHMIVHDLKNPLTAVLGTLGLYRKNQFGLPQDVGRLLVDAHGQALKLLAMIEDILIVSRMRSKEFQIQVQAIELQPLLRQCQDLMSQTLGSRRLRLRFDPPPAPLRVQADPQILERIINNLLNNAIKYAPADSEVLLEALPGDGGVMVRVTNLGPAIPLEYHERIFDLFCRVKGQEAQFSGTGLGLTFCKLAVQAHGGLIWVESPVPGEQQGARFVFTLPAAQAA